MNAKLKSSSLLIDAIRPFWVKGINEVNGSPKFGFQLWITNEKFQIYNVVNEDSFDISYSINDTPISSFAYDCSRLLNASIESILNIKFDKSYPKSTAWHYIKLYYSAFFAAHSLLRMLGYSITQFSSIETNSIFKIADIYGYGSHKPSTGSYICKIAEDNKTIHCKLLNNKRGYHEAFWHEFLKIIEIISTDILKNPNTFHQPASIKLFELSKVLKHSKSSNGNWLSNIRNDINYKHIHGCWFPYSNIAKDYKNIYNIINCLTADPLSIDLQTNCANKLNYFINACSFLVCLNFNLALDMLYRCPIGKSFHYYGILSLANNYKLKYIK